MLKFLEILMSNIKSPVNNNNEKKKTNTHWTTTYRLSGSKILIWIFEDWGHRYKSKQGMSIQNVSLNILDFPQHYW